MNVPSRLREFNVSGRGLSPREKEAVRAEFLRAKVPPAALAIWDYKKHFRIGCYNLARAKRKIYRGRAQVTPESGLHVRDGRSGLVLQMARNLPGLTASSSDRSGVEEAPRTRSKRIPSLDPGSAFGTGARETLTDGPADGRLEGSSGFLDGDRQRCARDRGGGRAVIVAGFDNDAMSVKIAAKNYRVNGCEGGRFRAGLGSSRRSGDSTSRCQFVSNFLNTGHGDRQLAPGGYRRFRGSRNGTSGFRTVRPRDSAEGYDGTSWASALYRRRSAQKAVPCPLLC